MQILYFAWVREMAGRTGEEVSPPTGVHTVSDLISWLGSRDAAVADALGDTARIRVAVNQSAVGLDHPVASGDEVAFFPPVTGG